MSEGDTFGSCFRQSLESRGLAPASLPDEPVDTGVEVAADLEEAVGEEPVATDDGEPASPPIGARIEPDGSALLLGTAQPNAQIHLFANGTEIGQTTADSAGDWIFIPDEPLAVGGVAITLGISVDGGEVEPVGEALAVIIQDDLSSEPTVVASAPAEVAAMLAELRGTTAVTIAGDQVDAEPQLEEPPLEVAALDEEQAPEAVEDGAVSPDADLLAPDDADVGIVSDDLTGSDEPPLDMAALEEEPATAVSEIGTAPDAELVAPTTEETDGAVIDEDTGVPAEEGLDGEDTPMEVAAVEPEQIVPDDAAAVEIPIITIPVAPSIDAVEIEPERTYIAGAGQNGATVRLFVDDQFVGDSIVDGGRWLVETDQVLSEPSQRIRVEMLAPDSDLVTAEAQIDFIIDLPDESVPDSVTPLILPADQLPPIELPSEAPLVVADATPEVEPGDESDEAMSVDTESASDDISLSGDELSEMVLPGAPPVIEIAQAEVETPLVEQTAESVVDETPADETPAATPAAQTADVASEAVVETDEQDLILPDDQVAPIAMPTEAPVVVIADAEPEVQTSADEASNIEQQAAVAGTVPAETAPLDTADTLILPDDQLAPIALPTEAPVIVIAENEPEAQPTGDDANDIEQQAVAAETVPAETAPLDSAEELILPDDQLAPIALPTEAPEIVIADAEMETAPVGEDEGASALASTAVDAAPVVQEPLEKETPAEDATAEETTPEAASVEAAPVETADVLILPDDQLAPIALPTEAPAVDVDQVAPTPSERSVAAAANETVAPVEESQPSETSQDAGVQTEEIQTLVATPIGDPDDGRFASGNVIIRRGDNLWSIARRVYGRGIEYRVIFEANRDTISNPNLIFPGQVFSLPESEAD